MNKKILLAGLAVFAVILAFPFGSFGQSATTRKTASGLTNYGPQAYVGTHDFSGATIVNGTFNSQITGVILSINACATGNTTILTPAAGTTFVVESIRVESANVSTVTGNGTVKFTSGATANAVTANLALNGSATGTALVATLAAPFFVCTNTTPLTLNVVTPVTAANDTINVLVKGWYH